ncbi:MAG: GTP-binding protein, partial [Kangiellaceae bacterium]|nr:GTP-binding protein [Kangiellaceae bacterium]
MNIDNLAKIPTNIITGFLGSGKTSTILHLLKSKPADERWAILVNEFGEIGIDGSLMAGNNSEAEGVFIREVPGGCMCCTANIPVQIALAQLIKQSRPDRLLIEPTGLGHPLEVLQLLTEGSNKDLFSIDKTITLIDARKLSDGRYTEHKIFNQQIEIADVIVANKQDLYRDNDKELVEPYILKIAQQKLPIVFTDHGVIDFKLLDGTTRLLLARPHHKHQRSHSHSDSNDSTEQNIPEVGYLSATNQGEGFQSIGWRFAPDKIFDREKLLSFLTGLIVERMKAVFITAD